MSFHATAAKVGNSRGLRLDAALFREHPEFQSGEFEVDVIAPGRLLVRAETLTTATETADPVLSAFLAFMDTQMALRPDLLTSFDPAQLHLVDALVEGVEVDESTVFPDDFRI